MGKVKQCLRFNTEATSHIIIKTDLKNIVMHRNCVARAEIVQKTNYIDKKCNLGTIVFLKKDILMLQLSSIQTYFIKDRVENVENTSNDHTSYEPQYVKREQTVHRHFQNLKRRWEEEMFLQISF